MMPTLVFPPATPLTCQVTAVFVVLLAVAVKDCVLPVWTLAVAGPTDAATGGGAVAVMVTCAEPERVGSATDTAVIVTVADEGTVAGAV